MTGTLAWHHRGRVPSLFALVLSLMLLLPLTPQARAGETAPAVRILTLDWSSQVVVSHLFGQLLERLGYPVSYLSHTSDAQWFLLSSGHADLQVEVWEGSMAKQFDALVARGLIRDAGTHTALTREDWWYPDYVQAACPGLPDWRALNACAALFAGPDGERGRYYTGPWEKPDRARIRALGLNYDVVQLADGEALHARLEQAIAAQEPLMIFNWTPNWVEAVHPGHFVEFPSHSAACETDPAWGTNPELSWDCGNPRDGWLRKAVARDLPERLPCAYQLIRSIRLDNADIAELAARHEVEGLSVEAAAQSWLAANPERWTAWLDAAAGCATGRTMPSRG